MDNNVIYLGIVIFVSALTASALLCTCLDANTDKIVKALCQKCQKSTSSETTKAE